MSERTAFTVWAILSALLFAAEFRAVLLPRCEKSESRSLTCLITTLRQMESQR